MTSLSRLQCLRLKSMGCSADGYSLLTTLPALHRLELKDCRLPSCLPALSQVRALTLDGVVKGRGAEELGAARAELDAALAPLTQLTQLVLAGYPPDLAPPASLAGLASLRTLTLSWGGGPSYVSYEAADPSLPPGLHALPSGSPSDSPSSSRPSGGPSGWLGSLRSLGSLGAPAEVLDASRGLLLAGAASLRELRIPSFFNSLVTVQARLLRMAADHPTLSCVCVDAPSSSGTVHLGEASLSGP